MTLNDVNENDAIGVSVKIAPLVNDSTESLIAPELFDVNASKEEILMSNLWDFMGMFDKVLWMSNSGKDFWTTFGL